MRMSRSALALIAATAIAHFLPSQVVAAVTAFEGTDVAAGPASPRPNSDAAAANFDAAAASLGTINAINFESAPLGNFGSLPIAPGVTATLTGTAPEGGIRTTPTFFAGFDPTILGYNTTAGGERFLGVVGTQGTARLALDFNPAIQAFGTYMTGLEGLNGSLFVLFNDGSNQQLLIDGQAGAGAKFFGLTDPGAAILQVAFELRNIAGVRDIYALDDIRFVLVPEPAAIVLATCLAVAGLACRRRRAMQFA